jgi:hypothetical protein
VIFPVLAQPFIVISLKLIMAIFLLERFVFFSDPSNRAYPLVRSFKASLLISVLFLVVCLFALYACADG